MANANTPMGARPVRYLSGGPYNGVGNIYATPTGDGTALGIGDFVKLAGTGQIVGNLSYQDVIRAATGDVMVGVVTEVLPVTRDSLIYRAASTIRLVRVCDDPNVLFEMQEVSGGTAFVLSDVGLNANFVMTAGVSTTTGMAGSELDNATEATTNTLDLHIWGLVNRPDNAIGANAKWLVRINRHQHANQVAGI